MPARPAFADLLGLEELHEGDEIGLSRRNVINDEAFGAAEMQVDFCWSVEAKAILSMAHSAASTR